MQLRHQWEGRRGFRERRFDFELKRGLFSQHDQNIANASGAAVRSDINNALAALFGNSSGSSTPGTTIAYQFWADTTNGLLKRRNAANSAWLVLATLAESLVIARSTNTILDGADYSKTINATSTFTQTLTAAATLGDGWWIKYGNSGSGVITLDPNGAETINGLSTLKLYPNESCIIVCNGTSFITIGLAIVSSRVASFQRDLTTASGSQSVVAVGFKPRAIIFFANLPANAAVSMGFDDGASSLVIYNNHNDVADQWNNNASQSIRIVTATADRQTGLISSMDDDGFTITWTKTGTPTGTANIRYLAIR